MKRIFTQLILLAAPEITIQDRIHYFLSTLARFAPIAFVLDLVSWWFTENQQFGTFMCIALILNMFVGAVYHFKSGTFDFPSFLGRNALMIFIVSSVYVMLEMLRYTAGDNVIGEVFRVLIQITALMYPTSKIFKNCYILSNGKYPPEFIMQKLYNFEKNGDLNEFFKTKKDEEV